MTEATTTLPGSKGRGSAGCLAVFGPVFALVGLCALGLAGRQVWWQVRSAGWVPVEAAILHAEFVSSKDDEGSATYRAAARYRYPYGGRTYESDRVSFSIGSDNIGSFHRDAYETLERHRQSGESLTVWIDPDEPGEAVAFRTFRWGLFGFALLFGLLFGGVGAALIAGVRHARRAGEREAECMRAHPDEPWRWRDEWQGPILVSDDCRRLKLAAGFAIFWNLISTPVLFAVPGEALARGNYVLLVALLFPLVGAWLIVWAVRSYLQWKRYGYSEFHMQVMPARPGSPLLGTLRCRSARLPIGTELELMLSCVQRERRKTGKRKNTNVRVLWQDSQRISVSGAGSPLGLEQAVRFEIPADARVSSWDDPAATIDWRLEAHAVVPGVDYQAQFELPVIAGETAPAPATAPGQADLPVGGTVDDGDWTRSGVVHEVTAEGQRYYFPPARHASAAVTLFLTAAVFGGAGAFIIDRGSPVFGGVFAFFGLLLGLAALHTALHRSEILLQGDMLKLRRGWLLLGAAREYRRGDIRRLTMTSSTSAANRRYYDIVLETVAEKRVRLASSLTGRRDTLQLVRRIGRELGVESASNR